MKFLLKQRIEKRKVIGAYLIYPGNAEFIKLANKMNLVQDVKKHWDNDYFVVEYYIIFEKDFLKLSKLYKQKLEEKRNNFYSKHPLIQLQRLLKYIFERNSKAKQNKKYYNKIKAYSDKSQFLEMALDIAKTIENKHFSYGFQEDINSINFEYVYFFQIFDKQVSFHSDRLHGDIPDFEGKWNGIRNDKFPFTMNIVKKAIKNGVIKKMKLPEYYRAKFNTLQKQFIELNKLNPSDEEYLEFRERLIKVQKKLESLGDRDIFITDK